MTGERAGRFSQRLSVVWFTDLVGYSALSARDHDRAVALVQRFQRTVERTVPGHAGRVVKFLGDAALLESPSAEAAVEAACELHGEMGEGLRTGIHLGDVTVAPDGDLYGDGVNGAQRIQTEAAPGQILVSEDVWRRLRSRPAFVFEPLGERQLKGVEPMELFRLVAVGTGDPTASGRHPTGPARRDAGGAAPARPSVAVLPFTNMSPQAENEYFSDGVTEEILALLARIEGLKVISRTSVMQYKGTVKPMRQIGEELGVSTILEGSVRHAGPRVRITAQLIDAATDEHLWAERYDRDLEDIFGIQSDVAERIVDALRLRLTAGERSRLAERPTDDVEAYQWYLKGRQLLNRRTPAALREAIEWFRRAVTADPQFAQAWVGLADALTLLAIYSDTQTAGATNEARAAAQKALALDSRLGEAYATLGNVAMTEWKWQEAEAHFERALQLAPSYVTGLHWFAHLLQRLGRADEAVELLSRARELDPLSLPVRLALGAAARRAGRPEEAVAVNEEARALDPSFVQIYLNMTMVYMSLGRFEEALTSLAAASGLDSGLAPPELVRALRAGYDGGGPRGFWEAMLDWVATNASGGTWTLDMAVACAQLGRFDDAFAHLERLVASRHPSAPVILVEPLLAPLRSDPRFQDLARTLGLP